MKISAFTRSASLVLAFGFFFACSSSKPSIDSLVASNQYEMALTQIEAQLQEDPAQPDLLIRKGEINALIAQEKQPAERSEFYSEMVSAFDVSVDAGADSAQSAEIYELTNKYWSQEHNAGTAKFNNEDEEVEVSAPKSHFRNAIIIKPEELSSYLSLSTAQYSSGDVDEAIATLNNGKNAAEEVPAKLYENLGFLYLQNGNPEQSVFYYELANKNIVQSKNIAFGLVNAYISTDMTEDAVELLRQLSEAYPNDANIRNVYGTQLYSVTEEIMDDLHQAYSQNDSNLVAQIRFEAEGVGEQAEQELIQAYSRDTTNTAYLESLAVFYNNLTGKYLSLMDVAFEEDKEALNAKASTLVDFAIEYYQKLLEVTPQDDTIEKTLENLNQLKEIRFTS
jgi:Tfp pilus assembly protein PilF